MTLEVREGREAKVRDEGGKGVQGDERNKRSLRSQGVLRRLFNKSYFKNLEHFFKDSSTRAISVEFLFSRAIMYSINDMHLSISPLASPAFRGELVQLFQLLLRFQQCLLRVFAPVDIPDDPHH